MTQAQVDARNKLSSTFFFDIDGDISLKIWKKKNEAYITLAKVGTRQSLTIPFEAFRQILEEQDVFLLAADFLRGLVGFSPEDVCD